jgi:SAM-dependent methyltransferase
MSRRLLSMLTAVASRVASRVPGRLTLAAWMETFVSDYVRHLPPDEALRFLFDLDERFYRLQGRQSIRYNGGIHTKHRHLRYHDFFTDRVDRTETVLDIGCGHGAVAHAIATSTGASVTGIDLSSNNIQLARERHAAEGVEYICGDALTDLPRGHYDVVVMSNVLEHIEHRVVFLQQMLEASTPRRLLFRVPLFERDWRVPLKRELGVEWRLDRTHYTEYTNESFLEETAEAGLAVTHLEVRWGEIWCELRPK